MSNVVAKIGVYGDLHLYDRSYGAHNDYAKESLEYFSEITRIAKENKFTHLIGLGDFSFGRFNSLNYRLQVEHNLEEQWKITNGNHYELLGNHDIVSKDICEREYYINRGLLKPSENISVGNLNITMVDYNKTCETPVNISDDESQYNIVLAHDFYKFHDTRLPNFGNSLELDNFEKWFGADILICGHVHKIMDFEGYIVKGDMVHKLSVCYPGCPIRPAYREGLMDEKGQVICITLTDDGNLDFEKIEFNLWPISESFNLEKKEKKKAKEAEREARVDISDVVKQLDLHDRNVGNPEDIISGMDGIDPKYKNKAIELLKAALNS